MVRIRDRLDGAMDRWHSAAMSYRLLRPLIFALDAERAHHLSIAALRLMPTPAPLAADPMLQSSLAGIDFPNPVGLAAGYDKEGLVAHKMHGLGFGFAELGTLTPLAQPVLTMDLPQFVQSSFKVYGQAQGGLRCDRVQSELYAGLQRFVPERPSLGRRLKGMADALGDRLRSAPRDKGVGRAGRGALEFRGTGSHAVGRIVADVRRVDDLLRIDRVARSTTTMLPSLPQRPIALPPSREI